MKQPTSRNNNLRRTLVALLVLVCTSLFPTVSASSLNPCALCGTPGKLPKNFALEVRPGVTCQDLYVSLFNINANDASCRAEVSEAGDLCCNGGSQGVTNGAPDGPITLPARRPTGPEPVCPICRSPNKFPSNPGNIITIRYFGSNTCAALFDLGLNGDIPDFLCGVSQDFAFGPCGCGNAVPVTFEGEPAPAPRPPSLRPTPTPPAGGNSSNDIARFIELILVFFESLFVQLGRSN